MLHNGGVEQFHKIKRHLRQPLEDELYNWIKGQTDSEHIFAYLVNYLNTKTTEVTTETVIEAFEHTFRYVKELMKKYGVEEPAYFNMAVTNGLFIVATRYVSNPKEEPLTLYHTKGSHYSCEDGVCEMVKAGDVERSVLVVSEKLTDRAEDWTEVPKNHFVIVNNSLEVTTRPIQA
jgi:predicted glutamine amidotransferase